MYENEGIIRQVVPDFHNEERFYTVYSTCNCKLFYLSDDSTY